MFRIKGHSQEEREASETRRKKIQERVFHSNLENRASELNEKLAQAQKQLREQQEASEGLIRQMAMERDVSRSHLSQSKAKARRLEGNLEIAHKRLSSQRAAFQQLVRKLEEERDEIRVEAEARAASLEQELATIRQSLLQERKAAEVLVHQLKAAES